MRLKLRPNSVKGPCNDPHESQNRRSGCRTNRLHKDTICGNVETLLEHIKRFLESGENVLVSSFGKFCVKTKHERRGRNPSTGEHMMLEPRKVVTYRCSRHLRDFYQFLSCDKLFNRFLGKFSANRQLGFEAVKNRLFFIG